MPFLHQELWLAWYDYDFFNSTSLYYFTDSNTNMTHLESNKSALEGSKGLKFGALMENTTRP